MSKITAVIGEPGGGKTRLAGTWPNPYWLNFEPDGNTTALSTGAPMGRDFSIDKGTLAQVMAVVGKMSSAKTENGMIVGLTEQPIGSVVIDSIDALQEVVKYLAVIPSSKYKAMDQQQWGKLADTMWPLILSLLNLPVPVVVIGHTREQGEDNGPQEITWALQGSFQRAMTKNVSEILHVVVSRDNKRYVFTKPFTVGKTKYMAKDRHGLLSGLVDTQGRVCIDSETGYPTATIAEVLCRAQT